MATPAAGNTKLAAAQAAKAQAQAATAQANLAKAQLAAQQKTQAAQAKARAKSTSGQLKGAYTGAFSAPLVGASVEKAQEHARLVINLGELATVALTAGATAEINHTRSASDVWIWRIVELGTSGLVMGYNGTRNTLGRIGLGVFAGALAETLIDSTPGLTGARVSAPWDAQVTYDESSL